jgi:peptide/nickel transport system substrate-binding protein
MDKNDIDKAVKDAEKVAASDFARLIAVDGSRILAGAFNRFNRDVNFNDRRIRLAFNLSVDREDIIRNGFSGYADVVPAMMPLWVFDFPEELRPLQYDPALGRRLLKEE